MNARVAVQGMGRGPPLPLRASALPPRGPAADLPAGRAKRGQRAVDLGPTDPGRCGAQSHDCSGAIALLDCSPRIWSFLVVARLPLPAKPRGGVRSRGPCLQLQGHVTHSAFGIAASLSAVKKNRGLQRLIESEGKLIL